LVHSFFFVFFSPALIDLKQIGITEKISPLNARNLRLITKTLQNLANGVVFGDKEPFMTALNPYLKSQFPALKLYFSKITDIQPIMDQISRNPLDVTYVELPFGDLCSLFDVVKNAKEWESTSDPAKLIAEIQKKTEKEGLTLLQMR